MCSIFGAVGPWGSFDPELFVKLRSAAADRGRDGGLIQTYDLGYGCRAILGNWRATPTTEVEKAPLQPYHGMVHNGTLANDKELGGMDGEVDSMVLARVLDRYNLKFLAKSLAKVVGSYALACVNDITVFLACNYKPIHYWSPDGKFCYFASMARHFDGLLPNGQAPVMMQPYSALDLSTFESIPLPRTRKNRVAVICSGGLDSTTVAYQYARSGYEVCLLHFRYQCQAEGPETRAVKALAHDLGCQLEFLEVPYTKMAGGSPLLGNSAVSGPMAGAEYAHEWVPARNLVFLSLAMAYAEANGYHTVALGNNLEESGSYPDNEEQMTVLMDRVADYAVQNGYSLRIESPVGNLMKHEIVRLGTELGVPWHLTWSCYKGGVSHCGNCGPCFMRRTAFERNRLTDPVFTSNLALS